MPYFTGTVAVTNLTTPVGPRPAQYIYEDEDKYYEAYRARLAVARSLGTAHLYFDGLHYLNITSECFLKYLFCLVRGEIYRLQPNANMDETIPHDYHTAFLFARNRLAARSFGHDLNTVVRFLVKFSDVYNYGEFKKYIRHLRGGDGWINTRYDSVAQATFQQEFNDYLQDFDGILNGCFAGIR